MIVTLHWQVKKHLHYIRTDGDKKAHEARFPVLFHLVMSANANLRCFVGINALCRDTGFTNKPITEALQWLQEHGAIYNVPKDKRVGAERKLHANKKVWQLTGKLKVEDEIVDYFYTGEDGSSTREAFLTLFESIKSNAPEGICHLLDSNIDVQNTAKSDDIHVQNPSKLENDTDNHNEVVNLSVQNTPNLEGENTVDVQNTAKSDDIHVQNPSKLDVHNPPEDINKVQVINQEKDINIISADRGEDFLCSVLDEIFTDDEPDISVTTEGETEKSTTETSDPVTDVPVSEPAGEVEMSESVEGCTAEEIAHFGESVSQELLKTHVYNPCHNVYMPRDDFRQPTVTHTDWQKLVAVVQHFFGISSAGYAGKIAQQLAGTAKSGLRKEFACDPVMTAIEACAFGYWLREAEELETLPHRAERLQERAFQFRELSDHFAHTNYARYVLADLLATLEPESEPEIDPDLLEPAPKDVLDKAYAEAEALLGFSLSGDF